MWYTRVSGALRNFTLQGYERSALMLFEGWRLRFVECSGDDAQRVEVSPAGPQLCKMGRLAGSQESRGPQEYCACSWSIC